MSKTPQFAQDECPGRETYHQTHRYCPYCDWSEDAERATVAADITAVLNSGPPVYCASEKAIVAATIAYRDATGEVANPKGLAAALVAAHSRDLGLDRSVCLRDLVDAPERSPHVRGTSA